MRRLVLATLFTTASCFYAPAVPDCSVACPNALCPAGLQCVAGICTRNAAQACGCQTGSTRSCGRAVGACREGIQTCAAGAWGACVGEVVPTPEVCDGIDNDCDGLTDVTAAVTLFDAPAREWRLVSLTGGYALVISALTDAGTEVTTVHRLGNALEPLEVTTARVGPVSTLAAASSGATVYLGWVSDNGVTISAVEGAQIRAFDRVPDAGGSTSLSLGVDDAVVAHWLTESAAETRLARWRLDGGLRDVTNTRTFNAGAELLNAYVPNVSSKGHYALFSSDVPPDSGIADSPARIIVDTRTMQVLRNDTPFYQAQGNDSHLLETPANELAVIYSYSYSPRSWSGIYLNPDLITLTGDDELILEEVMTSATAWGDSDAVVDSAGFVSAVYMNNAEQHFVLARSASSGSSAKKQQLLPDAGFGVPRLAASTSDDYLALAWRDLTRIQARRICPVR